MKNTIASLIAGTALAASLGAASPVFAANVGVTAGVGSSGYYGHIDINNYPRPVVLNPQPVLVQQQPMYVEPLYVRAPEWHRTHWQHYCGMYQACGRPVYFVQDYWYHNVYAPRYVQEHRHHGSRDHMRQHGQFERGYERRDGRGHG